MTKFLWTLMFFSLIASWLAFGDDPVALPIDVPPVVGTAITSSDSDGRSVRLTIPHAIWRVIGERQPKVEWPKLQVNVEEAVLRLSLDYQPESQLSEESQNRIVDMKGRKLERDEAADRLKTKTPVLIAVSGRMPDAFYLQCTKPDTLIVILGIPDSPAPHLLPHEAISDSPTKQ